MIARLSTALATAALALSASAAAAQTCSNEHLSVERAGSDFHPVFTVSVADTAAELEVGLQGVTELDQDEGMLFAFEQTDTVSMWMADTAVALDMIFVDEAGAITKIAKNTIPFDTTLISSESPVRYVLEVAAGVTDAFDVVVGDTVISPVIGTGCVAAPESTVYVGDAPTLFVD